MGSGYHISYTLEGVSIKVKMIEVGKAKGLTFAKSSLGAKRFGKFCV